MSRYRTTKDITLPFRVIPLVRLSSQNHMEIKVRAASEGWTLDMSADEYFIPSPPLPSSPLPGDTQVTVQSSSDGAEGGGAYSHPSQHQRSQDHHAEREGQIQDGRKLDRVEVAQHAGPAAE